MDAEFSGFVKHFIYILAPSNMFITLNLIFKKEIKTKCNVLLNI